MAKTICKAVKLGQAKRRGKPSIEWWSKDGTPHYYCLGYMGMATEELLPICKECCDNAEYAQGDMDEHRKVESPVAPFEIFTLKVQEANKETARLWENLKSLAEKDIWAFKSMVNELEKAWVAVLTGLKTYKED